MAGIQKATGRTSSVPAGLALGAGVSAVVTGLMTAALAGLLNQETIPWETVGYGILIMVMLSAYLGALTAWSKIRRQRLMICMMSGLVYFGMLLSVTALFFGGQYQAVGVTALLVAGGSGCAAVTGTGKGRRRQRVNTKKLRR